MPNILALDTSTDACSVALSLQGKQSSLFELAAKEHTKRLLPMVDTLLAEAGCGLQQLDAIAFGGGPGSFTGLRICLGTVQGLAYGADLPVIRISTLAAMAQGFYRHLPAPEDLPLLVALDARMQEVYWALFDSREGMVSPLLPEAVMSPAQVAQYPDVAALKGNFYACGPGWHYPELAALTPIELREACYPHAEDILTLAHRAFSRGELISAAEAEPVYLRDKVSWQKRQRIRKS